MSRFGAREPHLVARELTAVAGALRKVAADVLDGGHRLISIEEHDVVGTAQGSVGAAEGIISAVSAC